MKKNRIKVLLAASIGLCLSLGSVADKVNAFPTSFKPKEIHAVMTRVADWQLGTWKNDGFKHGKADWTNAVCYSGLYAIGDMKKGEKYLDALVAIGDELNWNTGRDRYYADDYCIGQTYAQL